MRAQLRSLLTDALLWALLVVLVHGHRRRAGGAQPVPPHARPTSRPPPRRSPPATSPSACKLSGRGDEFDQLAETINDMLDRMARLMEGVRQVSNAIAHDLRTPITRARARLEDARRCMPTARRNCAPPIERATADLDGIVAVFQALLRIAEIEAGSRRSAFAAFDVAPLLADVAELLRGGGRGERHLR